MKSPGPTRLAFTLLEAMISIAIFALLMVAVASIWTVSWRAVERVINGQGDEARADFVLKRLSESIEAGVFHKEQKELYAWLSQSGGGGEGAGDKISFVTSRAPDAATASADYSPMERIQIGTRHGENGRSQLVMFAAPFTMDEGEWQREVVLMENVDSFKVQFWSESRAEWSDSWTDEDHGPLAVRMAIAVKGEKSGYDWQSLSHTMTAHVDMMYAKEEATDSQTTPGGVNLQPNPTPTPPPTPGTPPASGPTLLLPTGP